MLALSVATDYGPVLAPLPVALLVLWAGIVLPFGRVGRRNDFSYGIYIYAFPVQQLIAVFHGNELGDAN